MFLPSLMEPMDALPDELDHAIAHCRRVRWARVHGESRGVRGKLIEESVAAASAYNMQYGKAESCRFLKFQKR